MTATQVLAEVDAELSRIEQRVADLLDVVPLLPALSADALRGHAWVALANILRQGDALAVLDALHDSGEIRPEQAQLRRDRIEAASARLVLWSAAYETAQSAPLALRRGA